MAAVAAYLTLPPSDSNFNRNFDITHTKNMISTIAMPFLPFHNPPTWMRIGVVLAFVVLWFSLSVQSRVFLTPVVLILLLNSVSGYDFYWWHKGTFLLAVLFAIFLTQKDIYGKEMGFILKLLISLIIGSQLLGTAVGIGTDFRSTSPYSNSKSASIFIRELCPGKCTLISDNSVYSSSISAYLDARPVYSLPEEEFVTYKEWRSFNGDVSWTAILAVMKKYPKSIAIVSTLDLSQCPKELILLREFAPSIWGDNYAILSLREKP